MTWPYKAFLTSHCIIEIPVFWPTSTVCQFCTVSFFFNNQHVSCLLFKWQWLISLSAAVAWCCFHFNIADSIMKKWQYFQAFKKKNMLRIQKMLKKWLIVALSININCGRIFSSEAPRYYLPKHFSIASLSQMRFEKMKKIILRFKGKIMSDG